MRFLKIIASCLIVICPAFAWWTASAGGAVADMPESALKCLEKFVCKSGVSVGYDAENKIVTTLASRQFHDRCSAGKLNREVEERYDFRDDPADCFEMRRAKAAWKAYADAVCEMAWLFNQKIMAPRQKVKRSSGPDPVLAIADAMTLDQVRVLSSASSARETGNKMCFEEAVAVQLKLNPSDTVKSGDKTLHEWLDNLKDNMTIGPASFCDSLGCAWNVGIVPVEEDVVLSEKKTAGEEVRQAKIMAYEIACRVGCVTVEWHESVEERMIGEKQKYKYRRSVRIRPLNAPSMTDASRVKWFSVACTDYLTAKKIRKYVCAIQEVVPTDMRKENK